MNRTVSRHFTCDLRIAISDKIRRLPVKYVDQTPVGDVLNRMIDDVSAMGNYIHQVFDVMVEGVFQITMIAVAMFLQNWVLACLVIVLTPISLWISSKIAGASGKYFDERRLQKIRRADGDRGRELYQLRHSQSLQSGGISTRRRSTPSSTSSCARPCPRPTLPALSCSR